MHLQLEAIKIFDQLIDKRQEDLQAGKDNTLFDFTVIVEHHDGSKFEVKHASLKEVDGMVFVFSEHNGVLACFKEDVLLYKVVDSKVIDFYRDEQS